MAEDYVQLKLKLNKSVTIAFYNQKIKPLTLELRRNLLLQNIFVHVLRIVLMTGMILSVVYLFKSNMRVSILVRIGLPVVTILVGYIYYKLEKYINYYRDQFNHRLVVESFNSVLEKKLECSETFDEKHKKYILDSFVLGPNISKLESEILSLGKIENNSYVFSRVNASQIKCSLDKEEEVFEGYIIRVKKKEKLVGHSIIFQNNSENTLGASLTKKIQAMDSNELKAIKFQNEIFNSRFLTLTNNFNEIKKNLTSEAIELILEMENNFFESLKISFFEGEVLVAIGISKKKIELTVDDRAKYIEEINRIYNIISAIDHLVYKIQS